MKCEDNFCFQIMKLPLIDAHLYWPKLQQVTNHKTKGNNVFEINNK